jgi:hypothetical protein
MVVADVVGGALIDTAILFADVIAGLLDITRIRYPAPVEVPTGIVATIVPEFASLVKLPISVPGNTPVELDN